MLIEKYELISDDEEIRDDFDSNFIVESIFQKDLQNHGLNFPKEFKEYKPQNDMKTLMEYLSRWDYEEKVLENLHSL